MKEPISIKEIFAIIVKRGKSILCVAIVAAILAGSFQFMQQYKVYTGSDNSVENIEKRYEKAMTKYEKQVAPIEEEIARVKEYIATQQEYIDNSIWMQLEPTSKYTATVAYGIMAYDEQMQSNYYVTEGMTSNFVETKIQNQILVLWDTIDLSKLFKKEMDMELDQKYWVELITLEASTSGGFTLSALGRTEEEALQFCQIVNAYILEELDALSDDLYDYRLVKLSESVRISVDQSLAEKQHTAVKKINTYNDTLSTLQTKLNKVSVPKKASLITKKNVIEETIIWSVLGAVLGVLAACILVWGKYILSDCIETSKQMAAIVSAPYFGTTVSNKLFGRWAYKLIGEPQWKDPAVAKWYISEYIKTTANADKVVILSTSKLDENCVSVKETLDAANACCEKVLYVNEAQTNPAALVELRDCKNVILAERSGVSSRQNVLTVVEVVKQNNAQIVGFVFV